MEEDTEGLDRLIKQKKSRPNYARIISMEFTRNVSNPNTDPKKKYNGPCQSKNLDECDQSLAMSVAQPDSDDSEYYSAEEFIFSSSSSISSDDESTTTYLDQSNDSVFDSLQSSTNSSSFFDSVETQTNFSSSCSLSQSERHRAPSKKQKRKRKKSGNPIDNYSLPFCSGDVFDMELNEVKEEIDEKDTNILKPVPSLVELSVIASKRLSKSHPHINIPKAIRRVLQLGNSAHSLRQQQLDCLFEVLELSNKLKFFANKKMHDDRYSKANHLTTLPYRNIWSIDNGSHSEYEYQGSQSSSYLPYYYESEVKSNIRTNQQIKKSNAGNRISALAHTIDLMLPARLSDMKVMRKRHKSNTDAHSAEMDHNIKRVKQLLQNKYTDVLTDQVFSVVLPYVFWARGDVKKASTAFLNVVDKEPRVRVKAFYMYEAGRMSSHFGDCDSAIRFYHLASDALFTKQKHVPHSAEVDRQTRMLCAAANDVGLLGFHKAERSITAWMSAVSVKIPATINCGGPLSAVDSFLCFFAAYWHEQTGSVYTEAIRRLQMLAEKESYTNFYLSMVYALNGNGDESSKMFRKFRATVTSNKPLPGQAEYSQPIRKPWQPLVDQIIEQGITPTPMKVAWRIQLVPPRFSDSHHGNGNIYPHEADLRSHKLNLRISDDGYLTGDMQMVLPPMRGIYMDLYTGSLHLTKIPSNTETWKTFQSFEYLYNTSEVLCLYYQFAKDSCFHLPTKTEMYRGHFGETIHMLSRSMHRCVDKLPEKMTSNPYLCHMIWTGADGQKMKIDVYHRLRCFMAEKTKQYIKTLIKNDDLKAEMEKLLPKFINKGWQIAGPCNTLIYYAEYNLYRKTKKEKKEMNQRGKIVKKIRYSKPQNFKFTMFVVGDYCVFNRGLAVALRSEDSNSFYLMIVDATSKETFMKPKFLEIRYFHHFVQQTPMLAERSDCFCVFSEDILARGYLTVDRYGEIIDNKRTLMYLSDGKTQVEPITYHCTMYGMLENKLLFSSCNGFVSEMDYLGELFGMRSVADILVLLTVTGEIKFVDLLSQLPLEPTNSWYKPMDTAIWDSDRLKMKDKLQFKTFKVFGEATFKDSNGKSYTRAAIAVDNNLLIIKVHRNSMDDDATVTITQSITLAGFPSEIHFINETVGFLLTVTQHIKTDHHYKENLYHYSHDGHLKQVLMCLGQGQRSFLTVYLPANNDIEFTDPDHGKEGWRIYMRDGHDGIVCVLLR